MSTAKSRALEEKKTDTMIGKGKAAFEKKAGYPPHTGKDCGYKCVFHNKGVKHTD